MYASDPQERAVSVSLRHLKLFESVVRLGSARRASEECHLSQPAVTQAIAKLELQVGKSLLSRRASGSYLNEHGTIFHRRTQRLFVKIEQALADLGLPPAYASMSLIAGRITRSQIRSLIAIAENASFAQAARSLSVSQTSLHRAARDLERNLCKPLYCRTSTGLTATPTGAEFARKAKLALQEIEWGIKEVEAASGNLAGQIVIGAMPFGASVLLASVIAEFVAAYPEANVRILHGNSEEMLRHLRHGNVDFVIGLLRNPSPDDLVSEALVETPYVIVGRRGHPLNKKAKVTLSDLAAYDWVIGTPGASRRERFDQLFAGQTGPKARIATCSLPIMRLLLAESDRLTLVTSYELIHDDGNLASVPFGPIEPAPQLGVTTRTGWLATPLHASFMELLHQRIKQSNILDPSKVGERFKRAG